MRLAANAGVRPPATPEELAQRISQLRQAYEPYLRSLPPPLTARRRQDLSGTWRWRFEVADLITSADLPPAPDWHRTDLDDADWAQTTVPEWRYDRSEPFGSIPDAHARRPTSRIAWYRTTFEARVPPPSRRAFLAFAGVDWEAQVWLNGSYLGTHQGYWEGFRLDATPSLREHNVLAVRVLGGPLLGAPTTGFSVLPCVLAVEPRYERDAVKSVIGQRELFGFKGTCFEGGFGIHREVFLELTGTTCVTGLQVRHHASSGAARVQVEIDAGVAQDLSFEVEILPENFAGQAYRVASSHRVEAGCEQLVFTVPMPAARQWRPPEPCLYRCRVTLRDDATIVDADDALFGCRTFRLAAAAGLQPGMFLLNDEPVFLRGTSVSPALNAFWYWRQDEKLLCTVLMMKVAGFNAMRSGEHVQFAEVRELFDRLGMLVEQDAPGPGIVSMAELSASCASLARACYNNPSVVLVCGSLETHFDPREMVAAVREVDPERILKPISGNMLDWSYSLPPGYPTLAPADWDHVLDDFHTYMGWYSRGARGKMWKLALRYPPGRMVTVGEFGVEALDAHATMQKYPAALQPPPVTEDALWGNAQVQRGDPTLTIGGRGQAPRNLGEFIAASQNYQTDALLAQATGFRLSPRRIGGYFVFHFIDALPAEWPKAIVSFDLCPKRVYFALAQLNQPVVPLFQIVNQGQTLEVWVANDLCVPFAGHVDWRIDGGARSLLQGRVPAEVPALDATRVATVDLAALPSEVTVMTPSLSLQDAEDRPVARFQLEVYRPAWRRQVTIAPPARALVPRLPDAAGRAADVDWSRAGVLGPWQQVDGRPSKRGIEARIAHDGSYLYLRLSQPGNPARLRSHDAVWTGDDWELFFARQRCGRYRQYGINPAGTCLEATIAAGLPRAAAVVVSEVTEDRWTVLFAVRLTELLPGGLASGGVFYANFFRSLSRQSDDRRWNVWSLFADDDQIAWTPHYEPNYHLPERFGELTLQ